MEWIAHQCKDSGCVTSFDGCVELQESAAADEGPAIRLCEDTAKIILNGQEADFFSEILAHARVGGDRSYGFGRLLLTEYKHDNALATGTQKIPGHVMLGAEGINGRIEAVTGRTWIPLPCAASPPSAGADRAPGKYTNYFLAYVPGSTGDMSKLEMDCYGRFVGCSGAVT